MLNQSKMIHRMAKLLKELGVSQTLVSEKTGLAAGYISEICSGKKDINERVIERICDTFPGIEPYMFFIEINHKDDISILENYQKAPDHVQKTIKVLLNLDD